MTKTVRKFSPVGPCINLGSLIKTTDKFFIYTNRDGKTARIARDQHGLNHIEPCHSCRDHGQTQYPNGYMD